MARVLYISYDGALEPLGQSQVLSYLAQLANRHEIWLLSFEKSGDRSDSKRVERLKQRLSQARIRWIHLPYHKSPSAPATAFDIATGSAAATAIALANQIDIVHARSYVPALMALAVKRVTGARFLFDMRGFWADERVDGGIWPRDGSLFRVTKRLESTFVSSADHIVTLTDASARELQTWPAVNAPVSVIPTCADLDRFSPRPDRRDAHFTFGYVGSVGTWYLFDETLRLFESIRRVRTDARFLIVNRSEHDAIHAAIARTGLDPDHIEVVRAEHSDVQHHIARMWLAAALIKPCYSKIASAPTKLAEYLGCGVPCVGNTGVGDMEEILEGRRVGVALTDFSAADLDRGSERAVTIAESTNIQHLCAETARSLFSLEGGVNDYHRIYDSLTGAR